MMTDLLIVRALRYQWLTAVVTLAIVFGGLQPLRTIIARLPASSAFGRLEHAFVHELPARWVKPIAIMHTTSTPVHSLSDAIISNQNEYIPPAFDNKVDRSNYQRWLDRKIADARRRLGETRSVPASLGGDRIQQDDAPRPAMASKPLSPPSVEELTLRRNIDAARTKLNALRELDTDAHPDVIDAREQLDAAHTRFRTYLAMNQPASLKRTATPEGTSPQPVDEAIWIDTPDETDSVMAELSVLLKARARLSARQSILPEPITTPTLHGTVLLQSELASPPAEVVYGLTDTSRLLIFEQAVFFLSVLSAVIAAMLVERHGDYIGDDLTLCRQLPELVQFVGEVPHMGRS